MSANDLVIDYAVRYCMGRQTYAFEDGLTIAERHWHTLTQATRGDVLAAVKHRGITADRYPTIRASLQEVPDA